MYRQIGFFSDAYCVEWLYTKCKLVRMELAGVAGEAIAGHKTVNEIATEYGIHPSQVNNMKRFI